MWESCEKVLKFFEKVLRKLWESCERVVRKSWESCKKALRKFWESFEKVLWKYWESFEKFVRKLWESCEKVGRKMLESCEKVGRKLWESCEKVVRESNSLLQLQTLADMFVLVCSHATSPKLEVPTLNRRHHDHSFAFQAKGHGKKLNHTSKVEDQLFRSHKHIFRQFF